MFDFENDVVSALNVEWTPIWINKRKREISDVPEKLIYKVNDEKGILEVVKSIVLTSYLSEYHELDVDDINVV